MPTRIDATHPAVAAALRAATEEQRRRAAAVATAWVLAASDLTDDPELAPGLDRLLATGGPDAIGEAAAEAYANGLDEMYWDLQDAGDAGEALAFSRARAATALSRALAADDEASLDAVFEAIHALEDPGALIAEVQRVLAQDASRA